MDNTKNDTYYINKIIKDLTFIKEHTENLSQESLENNEVLLDSMLFRLIQISESTKRLTEDYKNLHPDIPWTAISGFRNRIVHDYGNVDLNIVYSTLTEDIPELLTILTSLPSPP